MRFYVATSLDNANRATELRDLLVRLGHEVTFDWMDADRVDHSDGEAAHNRAVEDLDGVASAQALIVILPAGYGSHVELGVALGMRAMRALLISYIQDYAEVLRTKRQSYDRDQAIAIERLIDAIEAGAAPRAPKVFLWAEQAHAADYPCVFHTLADCVITGGLAELVVEIGVASSRDDAR